MRIATILTVGFFCSLSSGRHVAASTWTIPGTVNAGGLNNTRFVSDLAVTNPGSAAVVATISFVPANGTTPVQITLNPGQTVAYRNVLEQLWGAQGAGATQVAHRLVEDEAQHQPSSFTSLPPSRRRVRRLRRGTRRA